MAREEIDTSVQSDDKASWCTSKLVLRGPDVAAIVTSRSNMVFWGVVCCFCLGVTIAAPPLILVYGGILAKHGWTTLLLITPFEVLGPIFTVHSISQLHSPSWVFDRLQGRLWRKGKPDPAVGDYALLKDVEAVQICSERVYGGGHGSFMVYEIDLCMKRPAGLRIAVMCHGRREALFADARKLAEFLNVPMLDHSGRPGKGKPTLWATLGPLRQ